MRRFVVIGHDVPTTSDFSLDDLPGGAGRLDVLCRCVTAGLLTSHGVRSDAEVIAVMSDELVIRFAGESIRRLQPDERSTAARFRDALADGADAIGAIAVESSPGITVERGDIQHVLADVNGPIVQLHEDGDPLPGTGPAESATYVLSDHRSFSDTDEAAIAGVNARRVSVGPQAIHADQAITVVHNYLDTAGYSVY